MRFLQPLSQKLYGDNDLSGGNLSDDPQSKLLPLWTQENSCGRCTRLLEKKDLENYLLQDYPSITEYTKADTLYLRESRYGIDVDNARQTVKEGQLYQTEFIRCQEHIGLYTEVDGVSDLGGNLIAIGGENRAAQCHHLQQKLIGEILHGISKINYSKPMDLKSILLHRQFLMLDGCPIG